MRPTQEASAGTEDRSDALVRVRPAGRLTVSVRTRTGPMYEEHVVTLIRQALRGYGVDGAHVEIGEEGAYDHVILARLEAALARSLGSEEPFRSSLPVVDRTPTSRSRLRRSRLYVPGGGARLLAFADSFGPDCLLLDLEDAVALPEKDSARFLVRRVLATMDFGRTELWVRINPLDAGGADDLALVVGSRPHGICLPKAEDPAQVLALADLLTSLEAAYSVPWPLWIMPIIESPRGVLTAADIARASERVACLAFGAEDYTREVGARRSWETLLWARSQLVASAKASGVQASDTVYPNVEDEAGLREEAQRARDLGFDGKGVIHPLQIGTVHGAFAPSAEEVAWARGAVEAAAVAAKEGRGVIAYQGRMIDRPVLERAKRILAQVGEGNDAD
ncbi:MAG: HpcH/HpaI aldolase/citrate lyase family protein [Candidatus Bipolaricaulis sp.]|uniref:Citrate lyase, citryl-ACP lyase (Beta) subunit (Modular protein) n=1 Tax=Candidatus Bipolaricaulis anaerobius TaxID=2026885 RepID=A0A2X3KJS9_9BACT|nr:aldolase/citrate lyase family protein [Candidatus Bipolaricaulis anaerobius]MBP7726881.1 HpcH/HpaI aldolase/citrate lyase family protein [Candidatus Bipolaricaulis sp.]SQD92901.1 citrate lyase, citryl-ACP lyase (beta) subunit (modular protein) [Candidatus Bipolaricaulis anaerobius]